jgi:hypothetical protein
MDEKKQTGPLEGTGLKIVKDLGDKYRDNFIKKNRVRNKDSQKPDSPNYIKLINTFWKADSVFHYTGSEAKLYFGLLNLCNKLNWKNQFGESEPYLASHLAMHRDTIRTARKRLIETGLIKVTMPEKASKSVNGQAIYYLTGTYSVPVEQRTASTTDAVEAPTCTKSVQVEAGQPVQNPHPTCTKSVQQPVQNPHPTCTNFVHNLKPLPKNNKPLYINENEIKINFENLINKIASLYNISNKNFSLEEYREFLKEYSPEEIFKALKFANDNYNIKTEVTVKSILNVELPEHRKLINDFFSEALEGCTFLLKMGKLSAREKVQLLHTFNRKAIKEAIRTVEDQPSYRKGNSVYLALERNLKATNRT